MGRHGAPRRCLERGIARGEPDCRDNQEGDANNEECDRPSDDVDAGCGRRFTLYLVHCRRILDELIRSNADDKRWPRS